MDCLTILALKKKHNVSDPGQALAKEGIPFRVIDYVDFKLTHRMRHIDSYVHSLDLTKWIIVESINGEERILMVIKGKERESACC